MFFAVTGKIYPNCKQADEFEQQAGSCRFVWNTLLNLNNEYYDQTGKFYSRFDFQKILKELKNLEEFRWLRDGNSQSLQQVCLNLQQSLDRFIKFRKSKSARKVGFPKFKSKKSGKDSFHIPQNVKIVDTRHIKIPKIGVIRVHLDRKIDPSWKICNATIKKCCDFWKISITIDDLRVVKKIENITPESAIGIDVGIKKVAQCSNGQILNAVLTDKIKKAKEQIIHIQRAISRSERDSKRREKLKAKLKKLNYYLSNCLNDKYHKFTSSIAKNYDIVVMEDLNIQGMMKNHHLAKSIAERSLYTLKTMLEYKMKRKGGIFLEVDRFFPSSQLCSNCGHRQKMPLDVRTYICPECGTIIDRDLNASINILNEGLRKIGLERPEFKHMEISSDKEPNVLIPCRDC